MKWTSASLPISELKYVRQGLSLLCDANSPFESIIDLVKEFRKTQGLKWSMDGEIELKRVFKRFREAFSQEEMHQILTTWLENDEILTIRVENDQVAN